MTMAVCMKDDGIKTDFQSMFQQQTYKYNNTFGENVQIKIYVHIIFKDLSRK